ncbi:hypothetical protein MG293_001469 [Ovis ammon polii]|uniref:Uncharacterized protein n=1 Tax=Ovis ammon polii TaxID=230172 RepID=A0AAD4URE7_OVIAM|nr:hypothetical protein MG293_001469 [Ovis ammon polii]
MRSLLLLSRFSRVRLCATPETAAHQDPPFLGFSRQEHWSGLSFPSPGDLPYPGIKPTSLASPVSAGGFFAAEPPGKPLMTLLLLLLLSRFSHV